MCVTRLYQSLPTEALKQNINPDIQPTPDCMKYEWMRLGSFKSFPRQSEGRPIKLAKAGFVFTGTRDDTVTCFTCGVTKNSWLKYEDPLQIHKDLNPRCNFINNTCENVGILVPEVIIYDKILKTLHDSYIGGNTETPGGNSRHDRNTLKHRVEEQVRQQATPANNTQINDHSRGHEHQHSLSVQIQPEDRLESDVRSRMLPNESMSSASVVLTGDSTRQTMVVEEARLRTFGNWPRSLAVRPTELARAGFYYLGSADRVQCAFCRGILRDWEEAESPVAEHWRYFSSCEFLRGSNRSNVPIIPNDTYIHDYVSAHPLSSTDEDVRTATILKTSNLNIVANNTRATVDDLGIITQLASFPNQAILATRVATFINWPRQSPTPSKEEIAEAGFFYLGREDAVQCFYCAGILKSWLDDDIPWQEHAKWFPKCPYLLRIKGQDFIHSIRNPDSGTARIVVNNGATGNDERLMSIDELLKLSMVQDVLKLSIDKNTVIKVLESKKQQLGRFFKSSEEIMNAVLDLDNTRKEVKPRAIVTDPNNTNIPLQQVYAPPAVTVSTSATVTAASATSTSTTTTTSTATATTREKEESSKLWRENEELKERRLCKICMDAESNIVLLPCGHLVACELCAPVLTQCPMCRKNVKGRVKTYLS
ncbi:hypothetical protein SNE40_018041 [Patella caerulea]